jgi:hypothetical protein
MLVLLLNIRDKLAWLGSVPWLPWVVAAIVLTICILAARKLIPWARLVAALNAPDNIAKQVWLWVIGSILCFAVANALFLPSYLDCSSKDTERRNGI